MKNVERPKGYGLINTETGDILPVWVWPFLIVAVGSCFPLLGCFLADESCLLLGICFWVSVFALIALYVVRRAVAPKVEAYKRWQQLCADIAYRRRANQDTARDEAYADIRKIKNNEETKKKISAARKYKALIIANDGLPIVQGSYACKRGEQIAYFAGSVTLCEQRSDAGVKRWKDIDTGNLQITNKRIVFVGDSVNREMRIDGLASSAGFGNGVQISQQGRVRPLFIKSEEGLLINTVIDAIMCNPHIKMLQPDAVVEPPSPPEVKSDVLDEFLDSLISAADKLAVKLEEITENDLARKAVSNLFEDGSLDGYYKSVVSDPAVGICATADLIRCFVKLGHEIDDLSSREGLCLLVALSRVFKCDRQIDRDEWKSVDFRKAMGGTVEPYVRMVNDIFPTYGGGDNLMLCDVLISNMQPTLSRSFASALYEWAKAVAGADDCISFDECAWLGVVRSYSRGEDTNTLQSRFNE